MEENRYRLPQNDTMDVVAEPAPYFSASFAIQDVRHHLMDAIYASQDLEKLQTCLVILNRLPKSKYHSKYRTKTDEELDAELSNYPSWDEIEHPDLTTVDYKQYKHKKSSRTIKAISKWL